MVDVQAEVDKILEERGKTYGSFVDNAALHQALHKAWVERLITVPEVATIQSDYLTPSMRSVIDMFFMKLARIGTGNPRHRDNWADIAGYAQIIVRQIDGENR